MAASLKSLEDHMLGSSDIIAFIPTTNPAKARRFYERTVGLSLISQDQFAMAFNANGVTLRVADVSSVRDFKPASFTILGWHVMNVERAVRELVARGVVFERFQGMDQDPLGIWTSPGGVRVAWFKDPDGNVLSVSEH